MVQISLPFLQNHLDVSIFILIVLLWLLPISLVVQTLVLAFAFATLLFALTLLILFLQWFFEELEIVIEKFVDFYSVYLLFFLLSKESAHQLLFFATHSGWIFALLLIKMPPSLTFANLIFLLNELYCFLRQSKGLIRCDFLIIIDGSCF